MLAPDMISEQLGCCEGVFLLGAWYKYGFFGETINDYVMVASFILSFHLIACVYLILSQHLSYLSPLSMAVA